MNWILYSIKTSIFYNFAWFMKEDRHDIYQRQFESTADYFNKPFYMRISIMLKEFIFHHKRWKIRCNHLHKLMKITDRCFQDIPSKIFSSVNCCADDMNIKHYSAQTTSQWFSEIENATLKKNVWCICMMDHPCKVCVHNVCLPVNLKEDNCEEYLNKWV